VTNELVDSDTHPSTWRREATIAAATLGFGLLVLPFAIYFVGQSVIGDYAPDAGAMTLVESIWLDLFTLRLPAWVLVLSPYVTVQLVRGVRRVWRPKPL
jgi:hypothetical protein